MVVLNHMIRTYQKTDKKRNQKIYQLREKGMTFIEIGKIYKIRPERARQIYNREVGLLDKTKK